MSGPIYPAGVTSIQGETLALSTTLASLGIPGVETKQLTLYSPSLDFRLHINPRLLAAYMYDNSQTTTAKWINLTRVLDDRTAAGTSTSLNSMTASDRLFLCFSDVTGGFRVVMTASVNATANTMGCKYWNGSAWTNLTPTDGTDTGASLAQSGSVTWTAPTAAVMAYLGGPNNRYGTPHALIDSGLDTAEVLTAVDTEITMDADPSTAIVAGDYIIVESEVMYVNISSATSNLLTVTRGVMGSTAATHVTNTDTYIYNIGGPAIHGFWVEVSWDNGLDADTEIQDIWALNKNSSRGYMLGGVPHNISLDRRYTGAIEALTAGGTDTLQVTWMKAAI